MVSLLLPVIYLAFISLGLPDGLLGAAWPSMYQALGAGLSWAGAVSMIISAGTIVSSLGSDWLNSRLGTGKVTAGSVALTAAALFGFSSCTAFWQLCLWAVPYGLGAGSVDAALNNYVALHYESRHMSWLHCMWGIGATIGPIIMGRALAAGSWQGGYRVISLLQIVLTAVLVFSLPLWKRPDEDGAAVGVTPEHRSCCASPACRKLWSVLPATRRWNAPPVCGRPVIAPWCGASMQKRQQDGPAYSIWASRWDVSSAVF